MMKKMSIKQGDKVIVLNGKDKGKTGEVLTAMPREGKGRQRLPPPHQAPPARRRGRHHPEGMPHLRLQGHARVPQV